MPRPNDNFVFDAIGTRWWCEALDGTISRSLQADLVAFADAFDRGYSRFIDDSLVGRLNRGLRIDDPPEELIELLEVSRWLFDVSDGAFNITVGGRLHEQGYGDRARAADIWQDPWRHITVTDRLVRLPKGMTIDFGGLGKGWLIERLSDICHRHGLTEFIINGGGDMYVSSAKPIEIALEHPDGGSIVGHTKLKNQSLAVSSNAKRRWRHEGQEYTHLVDPEGRHSDVAAVYVKTPSAMTADAMATILYLRPDLKRKLSKEFDLEAVILRAAQLRS